MSEGRPTDVEQPPAPWAQWSDPPPARAREPLWRRLLLMSVIGGAGIVVLVGSVLFTAGEDLFGSDSGTIDSYNREVLNSCDVPPNSTLVTSYVLRVQDATGRSLRSMSHIYASPLSAREVWQFYGLSGSGIRSSVSEERRCKFGNRPEGLVLSLWTPDSGTEFNPGTETAGLPAQPDDEFWGAESVRSTSVTDPPPDTRSFVRLRLAQREVEGIFD